MKYIKVPSGKIDFSNEEYRIGYKNSSQKLIQSIKNNGILYPPILVRKNVDDFVIVSGFNRIRAACATGMKEIFAVVLDKFDGDVYLNEMLRKSYHGELGTVGKLQCINLMKSYGYDQEKRYYSKFGIPYIAGDTIYKILSQEDDLLRYLDEKDVPVKTIMTMIMLDPAIIEMILFWIKRIQIKCSNFRIIVDICSDISKKGDWLELFLKRKSEIQECKTDDEILLFIRKIRYPTVTRIENEIEKICEKHAENGISILMPQSLEGNEIDVKCVIRRKDGGKGFEKSIKYLMQGDWRDLIGFL